MLLALQNALMPTAVRLAGAGVCGEIKDVCFAAASLAAHLQAVPPTQPLVSFRERRLACCSIAWADRCGVFAVDEAVRALSCGTRSDAAGDTRFAF